MKYKIFKILLQILLLIVIIVLLIYSRTYDYLKYVAIILFMLGILQFVIYPIYFKDKVDAKKIREMYHYLKSKENKTNFETLFTYAYTSTADDKLKGILHKEKVKNISNLDVKVSSPNEIDITYSYKGFYVELSLTENGSYSEVTPPIRLINNKNTKNLKKMKVEDYKINNYFTLEEFFNVVVSDTIEKMQEIKEVFDIIESTKDPFFDKLSQNLSNANSYFLFEGIICAVCGVFIVVLFTVLIIIGINPESNFFGKSQDERTFGLILWIILIIIFINVSVYGLKYVIRYINEKNDIKLKRVKMIDLKPRKVRLIYGKKGRYSSKETIDFLKLYYDKFNLLIPFEYSHELTNKGRLKECYLVLLEVSAKIKYLEKSKIVISGANEYKRIVLNMVSKG